MTRESRAQWLTLVLVAGFLATFLATTFYGNYSGAGYPSNTFLFNADDRYSLDPAVPGPPTLIGIHGFGDFYEPYVNSRDPRPYVQQPLPTGPSSYFPLTHVFLFPFAQLPYAVAFSLYVAVFLGVALLAVWRAVPRAPVPARALQAGALVLLSGPVLFLLDRGNIEGLVFVGMLAAVLAYREGRPTAAALLLAFPIALKGAAAVLLLLFLRDRRWRALALSIGAVTVATIASFAVLQGSFADNVEGFRRALQGAEGLSETGTHGVQYSTSLKALMVVFGQVDENFYFWVENYTVLAVALLAIATLGTLLLPLRLWERVALIVAVIVLAPALSFEYRMVHLLIPIVLFLADEREPRRLDAVYVVLFGLLLVPKGPPIVFADVTSGALLNPLLLLALMAVLLGDGLSRTRVRRLLRVPTRAAVADR